MSARWGDLIPDQPSFYSIFLDDALAIPVPYSDRLRERGTDLIYVGIATKSLAQRLLEEDLRHERPSTFFRSLGVVLGYRPIPGSLAGASKPHNYGFGSSATSTIRNWIDEHLAVSVVVDPSPSTADECEAIAALRPLLNIKHNPSKLPELEAVRGDCRRVASGA